MNFGNEGYPFEYGKYTLHQRSFFLFGIQFRLNLITDMASVSMMVGGDEY